MADPSDAISKLDKKIEQILLAQANFSNTLHDIASRTSLLESKPSPPPPFANHTSPRPIKFDLPSFNGDDALGWIFKIIQFFEFHQTPPEQRTQISSFYLEGPALAWYQWMHNNGLLTFWDAFLRALELRFAPSKFEDPIVALCKLSQTQLLQDYIIEFESIANRISGYPASFYLSCFISGLKPHLRREVTALQPTDMPQAVAFAKLHDDKSHPSDAISKLDKKIEQILLAQANFSNTLHDIASRTSLLESKPSSPPPFANHTSPRPIKFDLPSFNGDDALDWIFKITQFFEFHQTPPEQHTQISSFYLEGPALAWYQWMHNNGLLTSWDAFLRALELRFAPSKFEDPIAALCKLSQTQLLQDYITEFESIANRISGYPASFYLSCFISGLKPHLRREILQTIPATNRIHPTQTASPLLPTPSTKIPIKRLIEAEMQDRRDKNLCYNCDERYTRDHRCKSQFLLLVVPAADDISDSLPEQESQPPDDPSLEAGLISLHSLSGQWTPQTFRITGSLKGYEVHIMVDSGATHNFIQSKVAHFLNLPLEPTSSPLKVMVGNGDFLPCTTYCPQAQITLASLKFPIDLYPLDLSGTDIVLGVQWLTQISPFIMDYNGPFMRFMWEGNMVELKGEHSSSPIPITAHQLRRLHHTNRVEALFQLILEPFSPTLPLPPQTQQPQTNSTIPSIAPPFQSLLTKYSTLFTTPTSLPPSRSTDHSIPLLPNTPPISVRPYCYPHFQKQEIETQVAKMLESGFITPNTSPFSSPMLLVKKKDGTWRFCVDYRAQNAATVKDKFPIPTVDELLDELGHASWFSKLDLFSGFHQILMVPSDSKKTTFRTHNGHFEFKVMPFGLCNAPSTFQATMNDLFRPHLRRFIIVFFDDILVYSPTLESHLSHLETTFQLLLANCFHLNGSKCSIGQQSIHYLGHIVSHKGVQPDPSKTQEVLEWPTPTSLKSLRGFLGLTGFYRRFVAGYASIASALTDLLKKDNFHWSDSASVAFTSLKTALTKAPALALPRFDCVFTV
ncbi:uncharacterized protein LOC109810500 [Cajanus cajan]|uniref:uncharacterized protein LOC109810500 n=1 Tax=Cajanus cajan TaxID=3821 RepID=UPI00098DA389|nr:uncharacterized protein LOC109810500 [Cajanus cajan]